jgi:hypothetical protein
MALKPRQKRKIFITTLCVIATIALAVIIIPPMITLNSLRPAIEKSIVEQTLIPTKLNGDIHFSLIGGATVVAHDVEIPTAHIGSIMFSIPFHSIYNIEKAKLNGPVVIYDADITVDKLSPAMFNHDIEIYDSRLNFMGRKFKIVRADFTDGKFSGIIRSHDHKYDVEFVGDTFTIKNKNNNLDLTGKIFSDGDVYGTLSIETTNINEWFGFDEPKITRPIKLTTDFYWNGGDGYEFKNIESDNFSGNIIMSENGERTIQLVSNDATFDFSFLTAPTKLLYKTKFNLDFYGHLIFGKYSFNHLLVDAVGTDKELKINKIIADDIKISGGTITANGASDIKITMPFEGKDATCVFSGTPQKWTCADFKYDNYSGAISVNGETFDMSVKSNRPMPSNERVLNLLHKIGTNGILNFAFSNLGGTYKINKNDITPTYTYAKDKNLKWLKINMPFLPDFIMQDSGDFVWSDGTMIFIPHNKKWQLSIYDNFFSLSGTDLKSWAPNIDLRFLNNTKYEISGNWRGTKISNLKLNIFGHSFYGSASNKNLTLHTDKLELNKFINTAFFDKFSEMEFLSNSPLLTLFDLPVNISLSADALIYDGNEYRHFTYALKNDSQTFSITDASRGNILATIDKDKTNYEIFAQLNRFLINGWLLSSDMPLNIRDTMLTGEISLTTHGKIAHDIYYNMAGNLDMVFNGGTLRGLSFDEFYGSAENITNLNAEYALARALGGGETKIKNMRIIGDYKDGNFVTTRPIELSMRHTNAIGGLAIQNGKMTAEFDLTLRGTAPTPVTIELGILPDNSRSYSLSEIMQSLDTGFMRAFVKTHDKF